jgi:hypothetical protein
MICVIHTNAENLAGPGDQGVKPQLAQRVIECGDRLELLLLGRPALD